MKVNVNEGADTTMKGLHQSRVRIQKVTAAPTTTPARSQRVLVIAEIRRAMVIVRLRLGLRGVREREGEREWQAGGHREDQLGLWKQLGPTM